MKTLLVILLSILSLSSYSQTADIINKINTITPKGWTAIKDSTNTILITKLDSVNICNFINSDAAPDEDYNDFIETKIIGKVQYKFRYSFEKMLTDDEIKNINKKNDSISKIIIELPLKYNIEHLSRKYDSFIPKNETDKQNIKKFKSDKKEIMKLYKYLPDFNTTEHSVYISANLPWYGCFCYPEIDAELFKLKNDIEEILTK